LVIYITIVCYIAYWTILIVELKCTEPMTHLLQSIGKKEQLLILLPNAGLKQISNHVQVHNIMRPTTVYERECAIFDGANDSLIQRLADVRNAVLMIEDEDELHI